MQRREFLRNAAGAIVLPALGDVSNAATSAAPRTTQVALVKTRDRATGLARAIDLVAVSPFGGRDVLVKPNCNSADPTPGSTHQDVLVALLRKLAAMGAGPVTVADRSGMGNTRDVMERTGVFRIAKDAGAKVLVLDELDARDWERVDVPGSHWRRGFAVPQRLLNAGAVVQTCCLKTHRYGGHFTLSLKNSVGLAAKQVPGEGYDYMRELHTSADQRRMIAEINAAYRPALVVLDGVDAFTTGGPDRGKLVQADLILAGTDRVAIDAVGVALLRLLGTTPEVERGPIFAQEQIARAVELGLGVASPSAIELVTGDPESAAYAKRIRAVLDRGGA